MTQWISFNAGTRDDYVPCSWAQPQQQPRHPTACILLNKDRQRIADPGRFNDDVASMAQALLVAGTSVVFMLNEWVRLTELAERVKDADDAFAEADAHVKAVVDHVLASGIGLAGRILLAGISRDGFAVLHATAGNPDISAALVNCPVVDWTVLEEFQHAGGAPLLDAHNLADMVENLPPRPILIQTGYNDRRVNTECCLRLAAQMEETYRRANAVERFKLQILPFAGHAGDHRDEPVNQGFVAWLRDQGLIE